MAGTKAKSREARACQIGPLRTWASCLRAGAAAAGMVVVAIGCGAGSDSSGFAPESAAGNANIGGGGTSSGASGGDFAAEDGGSSAPAALPPEMKVESNYQSPVATGNVVWIANPTSGLVAYIDSSSFSVQTVAAGDAPTYLAAIPSTTG